MEQPFIIGVTYRPARGGVAWWGAADRGALREDAQQLAALGAGAVRLRLHWESFQPAAARVGAAAMRTLEQALDALHANGLRATLGLFPVWEAGGLHLPRWAARPDPVTLLREIARPAQARRNGAARRGAAPLLNTARLPLIAEGGYRLHQPRDLFSEPELVTAQRYLVSEVCGYFGGHPAISGWQLAEGWELLRPPATSGDAAERLADLAERVREAAGGAQVLLTVSGRSLARPRGITPPDAAQIADQTGLALEPPLPLPRAGRGYPELAEFTHAAAAALTGGRLLALDVAPPAADRAAQAEQLTDTLERLWHAGAAGALLAALHDVPEAEWARPPFDRSPRMHSVGLLDVRGQELPAAAAVRAFAARRPTQQPVRPLALDPERYQRAPRAALERLWGE